MDNLLKSYARQRREQAGPPLEMHPATRQLLQAEVTRTFRERTALAQPKALFLLPVRLLLGAAGLALIFIAAGVWLWHSYQNELRLADAQESNPFVFAGNPATPPLQSTQAESLTLTERLDRFELGATDQPAFALDQLTNTTASEGLRDRTLTEDSSQLLVGPNIQSPASDRVQVAQAESARGLVLTPDIASNGPLLPAGTLPAPVSAAKADSGVALAANTTPVPPQAPLAPKTLARYGLAPRPDQNKRPTSKEAGASAGAPQPLLIAAKQAKAPPPDDSTPAASQSALASNPQLAEAETLSFQKVDFQDRYRRNLQSPPTPQVLTSFSLRRFGQNVTVTDADGSIYPGAMALAGAGETGSGQAFSFRVAGTNQTLNQAVLFTGNFSPSPASGPAVMNQNTMTGSAQTQVVYRFGQQTRQSRSRQAPDVPAKSLTAGRQLLDQRTNVPVSGRVEGNVSVGGNEFKVEAWQIAP